MHSLSSSLPDFLSHLLFLLQTHSSPDTLSSTGIGKKGTAVAGLYECVDVLAELVFSLHTAFR